MKLVSCPARVTRVAAMSTALASLLTACLASPGGNTAALNGPPFSADLTDPGNPSKPPTRIYLGDGKLRMESTDSLSRGALVLDPAHNVTLLILDKDRTYIDAGMLAPMIGAGFAPLMRFIRPVTSGDPCAEWNSTVDQYATLLRQRSSGPPPKFSCSKLGTESVNDRPATKWAVTATPDNKTATVWIDERLHVISKSMDSNGQMEMRNIHEGPQPTALFVPPEGYRKLGMAEMLGSLGKTGAPANGPAGSGDTPQKAIQGAMQKLQDAMQKAR